MGLKREEKIVRLTFGEDWIDVRSERKYRDTVDAQRAAAGRVSAATKKQPAATRIDFDLGAFNLSLLTKMIVAWSDDAPVNEDTIQDLPDEIIQEVLAVILGGEDEEEKAPLESSSTSASEPQEVSSQLETETPTGQDT